MKRTVSLLIIFMLLISAFAGCNGEESAASPSVSPTPSSTPIPKFETGSIEGAIYENGYLALNFMLPENWAFCTDEELAEIVDMGTKIVTSELDISAPPENSTFYEFYARDAELGMSSVFMSVEDLNSHEGGKLITVKLFVNTLAEQYANLSTISYSVGESYQKTIAEKEFIILPVSVPDSGLFQRNYVFRSGDYMVSITSTALSEDELDTLEACLSKLSV